MKKNLSPIFYVGIFLNTIGLILVVLLSNSQHNWIPIPVLLIGTVLIMIGVVKSKKK